MRQLRDSEIDMNKRYFTREVGGTHYRAQKSSESNEMKVTVATEGDISHRTTPCDVAGSVDPDQINVNNTTKRL